VYVSIRINIEIMKRNIFTWLIIVLALVGANAQDVNKYAYTIGIYGGIDCNINGYRLNPNNYGNEFYSVTPTWNMGLDYGLMVSKKLRPRIEFKYLQQKYKVGWENANISTMQESFVYLYNFDVNLRADYLLLNKPKFQIFASPALKWEFTSGKNEKNIRKDGTHNWDNYNEIITENPGNLFGGAVSAILKYNVTKYIGLTVTPEYTLFFSKYAEGNDKKFQRTSLGSGLEFNFY
jgi:hypothetical protein